MNQKRSENGFNCPQWIKVLNENTGGNTAAIKVLQEFGGSCLKPELCEGKALILTGGGLGKSTYLRILRYIVGDEKTSFIPLSGFEDDYSRYELKGKLLNIGRLNDAKELDCIYFKSVVTGDPIMAYNRDDEPLDFYPRCKLAFEVAGDLPGFQDDLWRRCLEIPFNHVPAEPDPDLFKKLLKEIDSIRSWFLAGLQRLMEQDRFSPLLVEKKETCMEIITIKPGMPLFAFHENYTRLAFVTQAFIPKGDEFWICLDSPSGVLGYFQYKVPPNMDFQRNVIKSAYLGHAELIGVFPSSFSIPDSANVYRLSLCPQQEGL
jgi:putative DNA primase/helicase